MTIIQEVPVAPIQPNIPKTPAETAQSVNPKPAVPDVHLQKLSQMPPDEALAEMAKLGSIPVLDAHTAIEDSHLQSQKVELESLQNITDTKTIVGNDTNDTPIDKGEEIQSETVGNTEIQQALVHMKQLEDTYLDKWPYKDKPYARTALKQRYEDPRVSVDHIMQTAKSEALVSGIDISTLPDNLQGIDFANDTDGQTEAALLELSQRFFQENPQVNGEKRSIVDNQTKEYLQLLKDAQSEGSVSKELTAEQVYKLVSENIAILAIQESASAEVTLGTHGVYHLVDHNITTSITLANELQKKGIPMTAKDKLILHQTMIYHDLGYATDPVRLSMREKGPKGQDGGHNVLAAKFVHEMATNPESSWKDIFSTQDISNIHDLILYHDVGPDGKAHIDLQPKEGSSPAQMRMTYLENIVQIADNTHAFADKLPPILYDVPDTLIYLRALKTAAETGDTAAIDVIRAKLQTNINHRTDIATRDKQALSFAVAGLTPDAYQFAVGRICGTDPQITIDEQNRVNISVQESALHQEITRLFDTESLGQLKKFVADLTGQEKGQVNLDVDAIETPSLIIRLRSGNVGKETELDDYEQKVANVLSANESFVQFSNTDALLAGTHKGLQGLHKAYTANDISEANFIATAAVTLGVSKEGLSASDLQTLLQKRMTEVQSTRQTGLKQVLESI